MAANARFVFRSPALPPFVPIHFEEFQLRWAADKPIFEYRRLKATVKP